MKVGDLVKYRTSSDFTFDCWLGLVIGEVPGCSYYKTVQWVNSKNGHKETGSHKAKDLRVISESW